MGSQVQNPTSTVPGWAQVSSSSPQHVPGSSKGSSNGGWSMGNEKGRGGIFTGFRNFKKSLVAAVMRDLPIPVGGSNIGHC